MHKMSIFRTLDDFDMTGKRVLLRVDINVPIHDGVITDTTRIEKTIPTLREVLAKGAGIILCSHLGRPEGRVIEKFSLEHLLQALRSFLPNININFSPDAELVAQPGEIVLLENLRFNPGEESNTSDFARFLSRLGDIYINDAFSCSHRAHASIDGVAHLMPSGAGRLMQQELEALDHALNNSAHPVAAVVGGNKISTKLGVLENLISKVDHLIVGGAMANTFLYATGVPVGSSLYEENMAVTARNIIDKAKNADCKIHLPVDAVIASKLSDGSASSIVSINSIPEKMMVLDVGPGTVDNIEVLLQTCKTLVWNGPLGAFEVKPFDAGTNAIAKAAARLTLAGKLLTVAGGGDTMSALKNAGVTKNFTYISSAGGAFLEWLEGKILPGVSVLMK
jgi:phosphoglycerate kinase